MGEGDSAPQQKGVRPPTQTLRCPQMLQFPGKEFLCLTCLMFFLLGGAVKIESYSVSQATFKLTILLNILVLLTRPLTEMGSVSIFGSSRPHRGHSREGIFGNPASFTSDTPPIPTTLTLKKSTEHLSSTHMRVSGLNSRDDEP